MKKILSIVNYTKFRANSVLIMSLSNLRQTHQVEIFREILFSLRSEQYPEQILAPRVDPPTTIVFSLNWIIYVYFDSDEDFGDFANEYFFK